MSVIRYRYDSFTGDVIDLARKIQLSNWLPDYVVGIARGGLVPATYLAQWFNVPMRTIYCSFRDSPSEKIDIQSIDQDLSFGKNLLIVDDIVDSGDSFKQIREVLDSIEHRPEQVRTAALWLNTDQPEDIDYAVREISRVENQSWIVFPWENFWMNT